MIEKFKNLGRVLSKNEQKKIFGGVEDGGCTVDCTGCQAYKCAAPGCSEMKDEDYVTCSGTTYYCHSYPTCWSTTPRN
jgi:hypothetical protein